MLYFPNKFLFSLALLFSFRFSFFHIRFLRWPWGDLLCVSISDLVWSSGSTKGWIPCFFLFGFHGIFSFVPLFRILLHSMPGLLQLPQIRQRVIFPYVIFRRGPSPFVAPLPSPSMVAAHLSQASLNQLRFRSPEYFRAGDIHSHLSVWERLLNGHGSSQVDLMEIIKEGVRIDRLFKPFKGNFKGSSYDSLFPPPMRLDSAKVSE